MEDVHSLQEPSGSPIAIKDRVRLATAIAVVQLKPPYVPLSDYLALLRLTSHAPQSQQLNNPYEPVAESDISRIALLDIMSRISRIERTKTTLKVPQERQLLIEPRRIERSQSV